ncbi:prenyltransferase [bacterium]|nr:prenyltransferase [bacterium]
MIKKEQVMIWLVETRANFLVLSVVLVMIGGAAAWHDGFSHPILFMVTMIGVVCAHISVNLFNEYSDWRTGIDAKTFRTPFNGGSGILQQGILKPSQVKTAAWIALFAAFFMGLWLAWQSGWPVLVLMTVGGITAIFYTDYFARWMIGEPFAGLTLGSFVVIGTYYVQTGSISPGIIWASISPGLLTLLLLFLNEFPDAEADREGGRRHWVIVFGKSRAAYLYALLILMVYAVLVVGTIYGYMPLTVLIGFITFPIAVVAVVKTFRYKTDTPLLVPALGMNVIVVLATDFLLALGYVLA